MLEGLYTGLGSGAGMSSLQLESKMKLLVEAPAAVEDALASLLDHHDYMLKVEASCFLLALSHLCAWIQLTSENTMKRSLNHLE